MPTATIRRPKPSRRAPDLIDLHSATLDAAQQLSSLRAAQGLSQEDLALRCNVSQGTISYVETGRRRLSLNLFLHLADALGAEFHYVDKRIRLIPKATRHRRTP